MWQHVNLRFKAILKSVYPFLPATKAIDRYSIFSLTFISFFFRSFNLSSAYNKCIAKIWADECFLQAFDQYGTSVTY